MKNYISSSTGSEFRDIGQKNQHSLPGFFRQARTLIAAFIMLCCLGGGSAFAHSYALYQCAASGGGVTFYVMTNHFVSSPTGYLSIDGTPYNFTNNGSGGVPSCASGNPSISCGSAPYWQSVTVTGISAGNHTFLPGGGGAVTFPLSCMNNGTMSVISTGCGPVSTGGGSGCNNVWQSAMSGSPSATNIGWPYTMGYHFTPVTTTQVTKLGGYFNGTKEVRLYNRSTGALLASANVTAANNWGYTNISPVTVSAGTQYTVAVYLLNGGASYKTGLSFPITSGDIQITGGCYFLGNGRPTNNITSVIYGMPDIETCSGGCNITASADQTICSGQSVTLSASASVNTGSGGSVVIGAVNGVTSWQLGNTSGSPSNNCDCPAGYVVVGYEGRTGAWFDNFRLICRKVNPDGTLGATAYTCRNGGSTGGGANGPHILPQDKVMVGAFVRAGNHFDYLQGYGQCISDILAGVNNPSGATAASGMGNPFGGSSRGTQWAPNGHVIVGMQTRTAFYPGGVRWRYAPISQVVPTITGYSWNTGATTTSITVSPSSTTTYTVTANMSDGSSCTDQVTVNVNPNPSVSIAGQNVDCGGINGNNGEATATASGGTSPYSYAWSNGGNTATITGLSAGTYSVTVTDANGCTGTGSVTIGVDADTEPPTIVCPGDITVTNDAGQCDAYVTVNNPVPGGSGGGSGNVLILAAEIPTNLTTLQTNLTNTGQFNSVSVWNTSSSFGGSTPTLSFLQNFDAVIVFTNYSHNGTTMSTVLKQYIDGGGGMVHAVFSSPANNNSGLGLPGDFMNAGYNLETQPCCSWSFGYRPMSTVLQPGHPVMAGVNSLNAYYIGSNSIPAAGVTVLATFNTGWPVVMVKDNVGPASARRANVNFFPARLTTGDATLLVANALSWVSGSGTGDNCGIVSITNDYNNTSDASDTYPVGTTTVTFTATDAAGNSATCQFDITVEDNEPAVITCPNNITTNNDPGVCGAVVTFPNATITDNCPGTSVSQTAGPSSGSTFPVGSTTVTFAEQGSSSGFDNGAGGTFTYAAGATPQQIALAAAESVYGVGNVSIGGCGFFQYYYRTGALTCNCNKAVGEYEFIFSNTGYTWVGQDYGGNVDNVAGDGLFVRVKTGTSCSSTAWGLALKDLGTAGAPNSCSFTVTVNDNEAPNITCPANITVNNDPGQCSANVNYGNATATDNCGVTSLGLTSGGSSGSSFPVGSSTVGFTASDAAGNSANCSFSITVNDNEAPSITCPADTTVSNDAGACSAQITIPQLSGVGGGGGGGNILLLASDLPSWMSVVQSQLVATGQFTSVTTWQLYSGFGGSTPTLAFLQNFDAVVAWTNYPNNGTATGNLLEQYAASGGAIVQMMFSTSATNQGNWDFVGNWTSSPYNLETQTCCSWSSSTFVQLGSILQPSHPIMQGINTLQPRCCSGTNVTPVAGSTILATYNNSQPVAIVKSNLGPANVRRANLNFFPSSGPSPGYSFGHIGDGYQMIANALNWVQGGGTGPSDNCGIATITNDYNNTNDASDTYPVGSTTVTWTATDIHGNSTTCSHVVTVNDTEAPNAICQNITVNTGSTGSSSITASQIDNGSTDNCGIASYAVSPSTFDCTDKGPNTVTLSVTDNSGNVGSCSATVTVTTDPISSTLSSPTYNCGYNVSCNGASDGSINMTVSGGCEPYTYLWSNGSTAQNPGGLSAGTYSVTITDANGDTGTDQITLTEPAPVSGTLNPLVRGCGYNISCNGASDGRVTAAITGGCAPYSYSWSNGATTPFILNVPAGTYSLTVTDDNGCTFSSSITLTEPAPLVNSLSSPTFNCGFNISCNGAADGAINQTVSGGCAPYTYSWSNGGTTKDLSNLGPGTYTVNVTDQNGCTTSANITLTEPDPVTGSITKSVYACGYNISCFGASDGSVTANITGGCAPYNYAWTNLSGSPVGGTQTVNGLSAGTYQLLVTDDNGCQFQTQAELTQPLILDATGQVSLFTCGYNISCFGANDGTIDITTTGGADCQAYSYSWSDGPTTEDRSNLGPGTYTVTVTDANGCTDTETFTLTQPAPLVVSSITSPTFNCGFNISCNGEMDGSINLSATGGADCVAYNYAWTGPNGYTSTVQNPTGLGAGTYNVTITDDNGCTTTGTITLTEPDPLVVDAGPNYTVYFGYTSTYGCATLTLSGAAGGCPAYSYNWVNGHTGSSVGTGTSVTVCPDSTTPYYLTITDQNGCTFTDSALVCVIDLTCNKGNGNSSNTGLSVCHVPPGNPGGEKQHCQPFNSVAAHLAHGDYLGPCNGGVARTCDWSSVAKTQPEASGAGVDPMSESNFEAYPNPFSESTTLRFTVGEETSVTVKVYNINGVEIGTLFEGAMKAGETKEVEFKPEDVTSGIYFARMFTKDGETKFRKLILNR